MKKAISLILIAVFLSACTQAAPEEGVIQTAIAQTQAAELIEIIPPTEVPQPTDAPPSTHEPISLSSIRLGPDLIQESDLGLDPGEMYATLPPTWSMRDVPLGVNNFTRILLNKDGETAAYISIFLYESPDALQTAFDQIYQNAKGTTKKIPITDEFGDQSFMISDLYKTVIIQDGSALVSVGSRANSIDAVKYYTAGLLQRLDALLLP